MNSLFSFSRCYTAIAWQACLIACCPTVRNWPWRATLLDVKLTWISWLTPQIHEYTGCKRTGFVKPGSVKLAMGHLLHSEAAPWNHALQTPVPPWIQGLVRRVPCIGGVWLLALSLPLQSPFTWPSLQYPLFKLSRLFACKECDSTWFFLWHVQCMVHGSRALGWFNPLFFEPVGTFPHSAIWLRKVGLLSNQSEPWVDAPCSLLRRSAHRDVRASRTYSKTNMGRCALWCLPDDISEQYLERQLTLR